MPVESADQSPPLFAESRVIDDMLERGGITRTQRIIFLLVFIGILFDVFEQNAVGTVAPMLREHWGLDGLQIGFLNTVTFLSAAAGKLLSGVIADRYGRRVAFNLNLALYIFGGALCAVAPGYAWLCAGRFVVGLGLGGEIVTGLTLLSEFFPPGKRRTAIGLTNLGAGGFGNMLAPTVGLLVFLVFPGSSGWRWLFVALVAPVCVLAVLRRRIPETPYFLLTRGRFGELERVMSLLTGRSMSAEIRPVSPVDGTGSLVCGSFSGLVPHLVLLSLLAGLAYGVQMSALTLMPVIFQVTGRTDANALLLVSLCQTGGIPGALAASFLARRYSPADVLSVGAISGALAVLLLSNTIAFAILPVVFGFLFYFLVIMINTTLWIMIPGSFPIGNRGKATAIALAAGNVMGAIVPLAAGALFDMGSPGAVFLLSAVLYLFLAVTARFVPRGETEFRALPDFAAKSS